MQFVHGISKSGPHLALDNLFAFPLLGVASQVLQVPRLHQAARLHAGLRRPRQGRVLQDLLRQEVRPPRLRLRRRRRLPADGRADGGRDLVAAALLQPGHHLHQGQPGAGLPPLWRRRVRRRAAARQGHDVAQEVLQLRRLSPPAGLDAGLRRPRQGDPLPRVLRQEVRAQGLRLRLRAHARVLPRRVHLPVQRRAADARRPRPGRQGLPPLRLRGVRRRADDQQDQDLAQAVLQLPRLRPLARLHQPQRRPGQRHLLPRLLRAQLRPQGLRLRHRRGRAHHGVSWLTIVSACSPRTLTAAWACERRRQRARRGRPRRSPARASDEPMKCAKSLGLLKEIQ
ncbi:hypothetical protein FOCC_FOCC001577 [Frankliniella occidentalis]|nr:hypothetical protein FOCC_FOCC001577 [Frankliniella occidentalis]